MPRATVLYVLQAMRASLKTHTLTYFPTKHTKHFAAGETAPRRSAPMLGAIVPSWNASRADIN